MEANATAAVKLGWLWFDNDPRTTLEEKVSRAAGRYAQKFGRKPRLCYVHQDALDQRQAFCGSLQLKSASNVQPGHFLFVVDEEAGSKLAPH
jgi:hypothetical protein